MTAEAETDNNAILRNLLESLASEENAQLAGSNSDNVAQLLAAAIAQVGHTILVGQANQAVTAVVSNEQECRAPVERIDPVAPGSSNNLPVNPQTANASEAAVFDIRDAYESVPQASTLAVQDANVVSTVEVPTTEKPRPLCIKFPIELRKQIISMRKQGKLSKDIAKELKVSVSGVQKVWERFLATGMAHDRKPSTYAGRPRKSTCSQQETYSPGFELQVSDDVFPSSAHIEYVTTPTSATPAANVQSDVIITEESEVFTEGATVEIVETTPLVVSQPKSPKRKGAPPYRGRLLLKIIEDCPLATLRATTDGLTNPHVQNLMSSITRPLYMEYVLGHPFGKVPPSQPFDGCTSSEAEVILSDPSNPVGKKLLAALGYSTKVYFNACCKPSPLFDTSKLLSSLPLSLGPGHLSDSLKNVLQLLLDLCVNPEEALNKLPTAPGPLLVAKRGDTVLASHTIPVPGKLSEFWTQLYNYMALLQCCENFVSAHPPSAPCLLCHPFENFAQSLEIKDPVEDISSPLPLSPLPSSHPSSHFTPGLHTHTSSEVEVQVLQSGTSGVSTILPLPRRGRGKGRRQSKPTERQPNPSHPVYEEQSVISDGEFEIPAVADHQVVGPTNSGFLSVPSNTESLAQVEASEAAENLAFLATHVTSLANSSHHNPLEDSSTTVTGGTIVTLPSTHDQQETTVSDNATTSTCVSTSQSVSSEIVAVAEVASSLPSDDVVTQSVSDVASTQDIVTVGLSNAEDEEVVQESVMMSSGSEAVRRSRRKMTRVKRLVSEDASTPSQTEREAKRTPTKKVTSERRVLTNDAASSTSLEDVLSSPPPAKRTRSKAGSRTPVGVAEGGVAMGGCGHPLGWGVAEVGEFIRGIPQCAGLKDVFQEHEVDGESLLSLDPQMMVKLMDLKTGPALRIHRKITSLKKHFNITE